MGNKDDQDSDPETTLDLFAEPTDYYPPSPKPTTETHTLLSGETLTLRLVGHNPLWGHHLWNAGRVIATYLEKSPRLVANRTVLELGAGAGLPSLVSAILGAKKVVVTDYPDPDLVTNLWQNIDTCALLADGQKEGGGKRIVAEGYCWGADVGALTAHLPRGAALPPSGFDVLILADLLFNHSEHVKLVSTLKATLAETRDSKALVFFTPYRPWLYDKDMAFFELAKEAGFQVEKILEEKMEKVMFDKDPGDEELRRTVFGYELTRHV